jgi:hypothetical protein
MEFRLKAENVAYATLRLKAELQTLACYFLLRNYRNLYPRVP